MQLDFFRRGSAYRLVSSIPTFSYGPMGGSNRAIRLDFSRVMADLTFGKSMEGEAPYWQALWLLCLMVCSLHYCTQQL